MSKPQDDDAVTDDNSQVKRTKHRSPNYPALGLRKAVELAKKLFDKYKRGVVPIGLAQELWEYTPHGSAGSQCVAALKAFGLLEVEGNDRSRKLRLTDAAYRIVMNSSDRNELLKKAVLAPAIHSELWQKYQGEDFPDDAILEHYLVLDRAEGAFNPDSVGRFVENFRDSLRYSGLLPTGIMTEAGSVSDAEDCDGSLPLPPLPLYAKLGDQVGWRIGGKDQYKGTRLVRGVSNDGEWVFIEGVPNGVPKDQVFVMATTPGLTLRNQMPPPNPFSQQNDIGGPTSGADRPGTREFPITLPSLEIAYFRVPVPMSEEDFEMLGTMLNAMKKKLVFETPLSDAEQTRLLNMSKSS